MEKLSVKTKSIYEPSNTEDGRRILITRYYPRGVKKTHFNEWIRALSPSIKLLKSYKDEKIKWEAFAEKFLEELENSPDSMKVINDLHEKSKEEEITLLCYEKTGMPCHRHLVKEIIKNPDNLKKGGKLEPQFTDDPESDR